MRNFGTKADNSAPSASGLLTAAEDNNRFNELKNAVTSSGITLDLAAGPDTDETMLAQAMARYASGGHGASCSGASNAYVLAALGTFVMPKALFNGMIVWTVPNHTNTGPATANVFGLGSKAVRTFGDAPLAGGQLVSGRHTMWIYSTAANSGAGAWLVLPWASADSIWITSDTTITVAASGASFTTIQAALDSLDQKLFAPGVRITISVAAGTYAAFTVRHIQGDQIHIEGATLVGSWPPTQNATKSTEKAAIQAALPTIIAPTASDGITIRTALGKLKNISVVGAGIAYAGVRVGLQYLTGAPGDGQTIGPVKCLFDTVAVADMETGIVVAEGSYAAMYRVLTDHNSVLGIQIKNNAHVTSDNVSARYNASGGVLVYDLARFETVNSSVRDNTGQGISGGDQAMIVVKDSTVAFNTSYQLHAIDGAQILAQTVNVSATGGTGSALANQGAHIRLSSCTNVGTCSPTVNTIGNNNSYITSA